VRDENAMRSTILLAMAFVALGQDQLTLKQAAEFAIQRNPEVESSSAVRDTARARIAEARSGMLPKVTYAESWARSDSPVFVFSSLLTQRQFTQDNFALPSLNQPDFLNNFQSQVTAEQPLFDAGKTKRAVQAAKLTFGTAGEATRAAQMSVIAQVARAYYAALLGAEQVRVTSEALRSAEADLERAQARRSAGMATDADVLSIRVHLARVREEQIQRSADLDVARATLNEAMGLPLDAAHDLTTSLSALPLPKESLAAFERTGVKERPEIRQYQLARDIASVHQADARANLLPQVVARGIFESDRQRFYNHGGANWLVSIGLRWNLFNGFADKARIEAATAALRQADAGRTHAESSVRLQVRQAWAALQAAQQRIETARAAVEEAQESLRISQNRYAAGLVTVTDLLRSETALLETQTRQVAAVHDQRVAATLLEFAAGTLAADSEVLN
jgi:outer membrane protein